MLRVWQLLEPTTWEGPKPAKSVSCAGRQKWHDPPEEVREEDDLLTGEELKLFKSVAARFNFLAVNRPDLLYSVKELMRKMASPRTGPHCPQESCTIHNQTPANDLQISMDPMDNNIEVFGDANSAGCHCTRKSTGERCCDVEWPIRESVVQDYGSPGPEQRRVRIGSGGGGQQRKVWDSSQFLNDLCSCGHVAIRSDATAAVGMVPPARIGKSPTLGCWRLMSATPCSFREKTSFLKVRAGQSERRTNQVSWAATAAPHENVQMGPCR